MGPQNSQKAVVSVLKHIYDHENLRNDTGPLQPVLDPVGKGLGTVLSPVGAVVSGITKPLTSVVGSVTKPALGPVVGTHEEHGKDSLGGRLQTGDNPLGLDQTGKFGFRDEK